MKALLLSSYRHLEIADMPPPVPGPDGVLVRVAACGICGSDVHGYDGSSGRRIPPIVMGHEAAGTVSAVGAGVRNFSVGNGVTFDSTISCGACDYCNRGEINLCDTRRVLGVSCADYRCAGAFAEYVVVPQNIVHRLPESLSFSEAAMLEAVSVALHAVSLSRIDSGQVALVLGAGMIGLLTLQALRVAGCSRVFVADVDASRLKLAIDLGASAALLGNIEPEVKLPLQKVVTRQIRLQGSCASAGEFPQAIELVGSGRIQVKPLITAIAPLEDGPRWFERLHSREPNLMKVVLTLGAPE
jgi:L-iditol 2-dehydrogenase